MTIKVEEKSLELALLKAAGQLGVTQDMIEYKVVNESNGFLGLFGKKIAIEAWQKVEKKSNARDQNNNRKNRSEKKQAPKKVVPKKEEITVAPSDEDKRDLTKAEIEELSEELRIFCDGICSRMSPEPVTVHKTIEEGRLVLNIESDFIASQISKNTKLAEALEHVLRKKPRHLRQELPFRIFVDCNGVRGGREGELIALAKNLSDRVASSKRPIVLNNYRSSYDRKIIHMALDKDSTVFTKSIGYGANRKLMILPHGCDETLEAEVYE